MNNFVVILLMLGSYFFGNISWALIISKLKKQDIRTMGSGNPGTLNMSRNFGLKLGLLTFFLDVLKGAIPVFVAFLLTRNYQIPNCSFRVYDFTIYACGLLAVLGHIYPVFLKFKGGKGIASTIGVFITCTSIHGLSWAAVSIMAIVCALLFIYFTEVGSMGSFIAITPPAIAESIRLFVEYAMMENQIFCVSFYIVTNMFIFLICFFTWFAHRKNIERMLAGEEHPTSIKSMIIKAKAKKLAEKNKDK